MTPDSPRAGHAPIMSDKEFRRRLRWKSWLDFVSYTVTGGVIGAGLAHLIIRFFL